MRITFDCTCTTLAFPFPLYAPPPSLSLYLSLSLSATQSLALHLSISLSPPLDRLVGFSFMHVSYIMAYFLVKTENGHAKWGGGGDRSKWKQLICPHSMATPRRRNNHASKMYWFLDWLRAHHVTRNVICFYFFLIFHY